MMALNLPLVVSFSWAAEAELYVLHFQEQFYSEILGLVPPTNRQRYNVNNKVAALIKCIFGHPPQHLFAYKILVGVKIFRFPRCLTFIESRS